MNIATRFEAFATDGGRPIKIIMGRVNKDPPPATVLANPAKTPAAIRIKASYNSN
jgi:hypothetical protein